MMTVEKISCVPVPFFFFGRLTHHFSCKSVAAVELKGTRPFTGAVECG